MLAISAFMCWRRRTSELCSSSLSDTMQSNALSAAGLVGPCLEKIIEATPARRKEFVNLRHDAKACRTCSEPLACPPSHRARWCCIYGVL